MNQKIIFGVSVLALLALTTCYITLREKNQVGADLVKATWSQWQQCLNENGYNPFCNMYAVNSTEFKRCQNVYSQISSCENNNNHCLRWFIYTEGYEEDAPLPIEFYTCTEACQQYAVGDPAVEQNYNIEHYQCAYVN